MPQVTINWLAILVSGVASMIVGFLWYSPILFGKPWMKLSGMNDKDFEKAKQDMTKTYGISFVASLLMAFVLTHSIAQGGAFYKLSGPIVGFQGAFWSWLGFVMRVQLTSWLYDKKPFQLFLINTGYQLASLLVMGLILVSWM